MCLKSETSDLVKSFVTLIQTHFHKTIKIIRSDNGPEFILKYFYKTHGFYIKLLMLQHLNKMVLLSGNINVF